MNAASWYAEGKTERVMDLDVFVRRSGQGASLICIHGFPSSSWDFEAIWPSLVHRFNVIAHDLIGLGKSAKPNRHLPVSLQADIIEQLMLNAGIKEAHILAHDLGDTVAQELLARQSEKSSRIKWLSCVFMNGGLFPETHRARPVQKLLLSPIGPLLAGVMSEKSLRKNLNAVFSKAHPPTEEFVHETWKLICENEGLRMLPVLLHYIKERKKFRERWVWPLMNGIVPMRLITGAEDPVSGKHAAERFKELITGADVVLLENCGHYPHVEMPAELVRVFFDFHDGLIT